MHHCKKKKKKQRKIIVFDKEEHETSDIKSNDLNPIIEIEEPKMATQKIKF